MTVSLHYKLHEVAPLINWGYFFHAWGLPFSYGELIAQECTCPACQSVNQRQLEFSEQRRQQEARELYQEALALLIEMEEKGILSHARIGLYDANGRDNDILIWDDEGRKHILPLLRQQHGQTCRCLSDYIRPYNSGVRDRIGVFVSSVDEAMEKSYPDDHYRHFICQTLADRLAEATIETAHQYVRRQLWGYASDENLTTQQLWDEAYQGRRPAVGYPSIPDQSFNFLLDDILDYSQIGVRLTQSAAMIPHASTSGLMISHPAMRHFAVGKIGPDQLADYARRCNKSIQQVKVFLSANL